MITAGIVLAGVAGLLTRMIRDERNEPARLAVIREYGQAQYRWEILP